MTDYCVIHSRRLTVKESLGSKRDLSTETVRQIAARFHCSPSTVKTDVKWLRNGGFYTPSPRLRLRRAVLKRDKCCQYCGADETTRSGPWGLIAEHVVPKKMGGPDAEFNLVKACTPCNATKKRSVWIPRNFDLLAQLNKRWARKILKLAKRDSRIQPELKLI